MIWRLPRLLKVMRVLKYKSLAHAGKLPTPQSYHRPDDNKGLLKVLHVFKCKWPRQASASKPPSYVNLDWGPYMNKEMKVMRVLKYKSLTHAGKRLGPRALQLVAPTHANSISHCLKCNAGVITCQVFLSM